MGAGAAALHAGAKDETPLLYTRLNDAGTEFEPERNLITYAYGLDGGSSVAADPQGNVYVIWHAPQLGNTNGEAGRAVFVARSNDEGKTFQRESLATSDSTGACGCCDCVGVDSASSHARPNANTVLLTRASLQLAGLNSRPASQMPNSSRPNFGFPSSATEGISPHPCRSAAERRCE